MKKIISLFLIAILLNSNFFIVNAQFNPCGKEPGITASDSDKQAYQDCIRQQGGGTETNNGCTKDSQCIIGVEKCQINYVVSPPAGTCVSIINPPDTSCDSCKELNTPSVCAQDETQKTCNNKSYCCPITDNTGDGGGGGNSSTSVMGITCNQDQLVNGQCKLNIYDTLGIRKSVRNEDDPTSVGLFVQDVILSATFFIGTLVTIALIVSGLMFIFAASSGKNPEKAKNGMIGSLIGLLIVVSSYVIIRLVQYIAKGF